MIKVLRLLGIASLLLLLAWAAWEARWQPHPLSAVPATDDTIPEDALAPLQFSQLADNSDTLQRPLFFPGRAPFSPEERGPQTTSDDDEQPKPMSSARPVLRAIIVEDEQRSALIQLPGQAGSVRLRSGESEAGWRLLSIEDDAVTVEAGSRRETLPLRDFASMPVPQPVRRAAPQAAPRKMAIPGASRGRFGGGNDEPPEPE